MNDVYGQTHRPMLRSHCVRPIVSMAAFGLGGLALVALGALIAALWLPQEVPPLVAPGGSASTQTMTVSSEVYDGGHDATATARSVPAQVLRAPVSGVVTTSHCSPGAHIVSGSAPLWVNGAPVVALATTTPLWRDLGPGDKGTDVSALQAELVRLGYDTTVTGTFGSATEGAVKQLLAGQGALAQDGTLRLASVMWLPGPDVRAVLCSVGIGDPVVVGQETFRSSGALVSLTLAYPPGEGWVAQFDGTTAPIDTSGQITDATFLATVEESAEYQFAQTQGSAQVSLRILLASPIRVLAVPPGAIVATSAGSGCVVSAGRAIPIRIVSSSLGKTLVSVNQVAEPTEVKLHPDPRTPCPS